MRRGCFAGAGDLVFGDEEPFKLAGAFFEEVFEGSANVAFVVEFAATEFVECFVIKLDGGVGRFEIQLSHCVSKLGYGEVMQLGEGDLARCL